MSLAEISIKRHVFATMINLVVVLFGIISINRIAIDRTPDIDFSLLAVTTVLPGANPDVVDSSVTNIIEGAVNSIAGIDELRARSETGFSTVFPTFVLEKDLDVAFNETQEKVNQVIAQLPTDTETPIINKIATGEIPAMWLALTGDRTLQELDLYARNIIKRKLETIKGVAKISIGGGRERNIRVNLNFDRMSAFGITVQDIVRAFRNEHIKLPGGFLIENSKEELLKLDLEYHSPEDVGNIIVAYTNNNPIKLKNIAQIEDDVSDLRNLARFQGKPAIGLGVGKIRGENTIEVIEAVKQRIETDILPFLPDGMMLDYATDDSEYIYEIITGLGQHLIAGAIFAALVVLLFLRSFIGMGIVAITIPVSLLGSIVVMYFFGYSLNTMTMLGLLLLIGVVVDDAIVVLENSQRHLDTSGLDRIRSTIIGTNEVFLPIVASTLTLAAIFTVVIFLEGIAGRFFRSFGVVVSSGVIISLFISLTLTPMLCSQWLKPSTSINKFFERVQNFFMDLEERYRNLVYWAINNKRKVVISGLVIVSSTALFFQNLEGSFFPKEDEGQFSVTVKTPLGSGIEYSNDRVGKVEEILRNYEDIDSLFSIVGGTSGDGASGTQINESAIYVKLKPRTERTLKQYELIPLIRAKLAEVPGVKAFPSPLSFASGTRGEALQFTLAGPDLYVLDEVAKIFLAKLSETPELGNVDMSMDMEMPQVALDINRELVSELGLSTKIVAEAANVFAGGIDVARYNDSIGGGERYKIRLKAEQNMSISDLNKIYLRTPNADLVRLDTVAAFSEIVGPASISRFNREYASYFFTDPTMALSDAIDTVESAAAETLPPGYHVNFFARAKEFKKTSNTMLIAFLTGLLLVYMVLASQFNSFSQPLIIMVSQPLAVLGGIFGLWIAGIALNIFSMTGLVLLTGLVAKNSILLVDRANEEMKTGKNADEALLVACPRRLRPILMTSFTIILAMLMPALGIGAGIELSQPLAVAVVGGMFSSTLLTLILVPVVYSWAEDKKRAPIRKSLGVLVGAIRK